MDTGTHFVMGIGLAGLAHLDPVVAATPGMGEAMLAACILGSQAPDVDTFFRLKGNSHYIRHHRGLSHSFPCLLLYSFIITTAIALPFPHIDRLHLFGWTLFSAVVHVLTDLLNAYGTQAFRPFSRRWISWNILHIFDPVLFAIHLAGIGAWFLGFPPGPIFGAAYLLMLLYLLWRIGYYRLAKRRLAGELEEGEIHLFPSLHPLQWNLIWYADRQIRLGKRRLGKVVWNQDLHYQPHHPVVDAARQHPDIQHFLTFSRHPYLTYQETDFGYQVQWIDLRYRHKRNFPLLAAVYLDKKHRIIGHYIGWMKEEKVTKRLDVSLGSNA